MKHVILAAMAVLALAAASATAQKKAQSGPLTNGDIIEMSKAGVPVSTIMTAMETSPVKFNLSPEGIIALHAAGVSEQVLNRMLVTNARTKFASSFGVATGTFPVADSAGKTVRFSAYIKTDNVQNGYAGLWWRADSEEKGKTLAFDNSQARFVGDAPVAGNNIIRGATGTTGWTQYEIEIPVTARAKNINFGLLFTGTGTAWFDSLKIELDGAPYTNPDVFDADFESGAPKTFFTGGQGYRVGVDNTTAWTGSQSLKMQFIGDGATGK